MIYLDGQTGPLIRQTQKENTVVYICYVRFILIMLCWVKFFNDLIACRLLLSKEIQLFIAGFLYMTCHMLHIIQAAREDIFTR